MVLELGRQVVTVGFEPSVHASGIGLGHRFRVGGKAGPVASRRCFDPDPSEEGVLSDGGGSGDLGPPACCFQPVVLHLPDAVGRSAVPLCLEGRVGVEGSDVGDAPAVAGNGGVHEVASVGRGPTTLAQLGGSGGHDGPVVEAVEEQVEHGVEARLVVAAPERIGGSQGDEAVE